MALTQAGMSREAAYSTVQDNAMKVWAGEGGFLSLLKDDPGVAKHLDAKTLDSCFDDAHHTRHVETIFARVFG